MLLLLLLLLLQVVMLLQLLFLMPRREACVQERLGFVDDVRVASSFGRVFGRFGRAAGIARLKNDLDGR